MCLVVYGRYYGVTVGVEARARVVRRDEKAFTSVQNDRSPATSITGGRVTRHPVFPALRRCAAFVRESDASEASFPRSMHIGYIPLLLAKTLFLN